MKYRAIDEQQMALECLKLAKDQHSDTKQTVARAKAFYAFVNGDDGTDANHSVTA